MAVYTIGTPDGRKLRIEAADEATAIRGAQEWTAANPAQAPAPATGPATPPAGLKPGTREYADWAAQAARAGQQLPQVSNPAMTETQSSILDPFVQGTTFGFADEMRGAVQGGLAAMQGGEFGSVYDQTVDESRGALAHERNVNPWGSIASEVAGAIPTGMVAGGQLAGRGATALARAATGALVGGAQGVAYGAGSSEADTLEGRITDGAVPGLVGAGIGAAAPLIGQLGRRLISPNPASASQTNAAQVMAREGVDLTAGQMTGNKGLQYLESELGKGRAADLMEQQAEQFTQSVLRRAGINAQRATPEVIDTAFDTIGQQFDNMAMITDTPFDSALQNNLLGVAADYIDTAANPAPVVERLVNRLGELAQSNGGRVTGRVYQNMRSEIGRLIRAADPATKMALRELQDALDDGIERNLSGQTLEAWRALRRQYQNMLIVERGVTSAGQNAASGLITPAQLRSAAINIGGRRSFARGTNDFTELANAAVQTMTPLPQSGTAPRFAAQMLGTIPAAIGAAAGSPAGIPGAIGGALVGAAVPAAVGRAVLSGPGRAYLSNQVATGVGPSALEAILRRAGTPAVGQLPGR